MKKEDQDEIGRKSNLHLSNKIERIIDLLCDLMKFHEIPFEIGSVAMLTLIAQGTQHWEDSDIEEIFNLIKYVRKQVREDMQKDKS